MSIVNKKRSRTRSPDSCSDDVEDDEHRRNPKTHKIGKIGGKRQNLEGNKAGDPEFGINSNTCLVCDGKDNWVLVCHGEDCPLAIHQACTSDEPDFDEFGNFYCPYCWHKRLLFKFMKLHKKLMMTETSRKARETLGGVGLALMTDRVTEEADNAVEVNVSGGRTTTTSVNPSMKLHKKLMMTETSRKGRETLGGVGLALMTDRVTEEADNAVEVNVSGGRTTTTSVNPSENRMKCDESNKKCMLMGKTQQKEEATVETHCRKVSMTDVSEESQQQGRFSEKIQETSDACYSNVGEGRKGRARHSGDQHHEKVQVHNSDTGEERMQQSMCDINHGTTQARCCDASVKSRNRRRYSEENQQNKIVAGTHEHDCYTNDERKQACNSDLGEGTNRQGCCHENNQQNKVFCAETCEKEVPKNDNRVSTDSDLEEGTNRQGSQHIKTIETEIHRKEVSKDQERKRKRAVARDLVEDEDEQCQSDMRKDDGEENCFRKDEQAEKMVSSPLSLDNCSDSNAACQELALIIHPAAGVQEQPLKAQPFRSVSFQPQKFRQKSYLEKNGTASNDHGQREFVLCNDKKRKRLFWRQAEEEMLRVGVHKFPGVRNIPWRKILEFGRDVFHDDRVPSDLKDKWKNMNKMSVSLSTERQPNHEACYE